MKAFLSLALASCLSSSAYALKGHFSHGVIIEYEDWATEDNNALLENIKATLDSSKQVDEVDVKPRVEISSSIFRGVSCNIFGVGDDVSTNLIQSKIQNLRAVKKVSPITALHLHSPIDALPHSALEPRSNFGSLNAGPQVFAREDSTVFSTHAMTGVDKLHSEGIKGKGITVAIMDTGFDYKQDALGNSIGPGQKVTYGYDWVGDDYSYETGAVAVEDGDPYADCSFHGTHVFGTVGANPTRFGVSGVAPEASFELHRVFGCTGAVGDDIVIKASIAIYERGVDIITASIGGGSTYPDDPWSTVVQRINQNGTYFQVSAGNGGAGYYTGSEPSSGIDVIAIGAVFNTETPYYLWHGNYTSGNTTTDLTWVPGNKPNFPSGFNLWTASSSESDLINTGCGPYPSDLALPDFNTTVVLISRPFVPPCGGVQAQQYLASIGAKYVLFYTTQADDPVTGPIRRNAEEGIIGIGNLPGTVGMDLFAAYQKDKNITVSWSSSSAYTDSVTVQKNDISGGRMTDYSSWGPTQDGRSFPTISAPGGQILSTFPKKLGGFGQISGTSMAAPFAAGVAALLMQQHPDWDSATIRNVLATTGNPMQYNDNSTTVYDFLAPVFQQGGGLIDAYRAIHTTTVVDVPNLSFNDTANQPKTLSFKVKNIGTIAQTFKLSHIGAASGLGISAGDIYSASTDSSRQLSKNLQGVYATLEITPPEVTIAAGQESTITVAVTQLPSLDSKLLPFYGGYIALNSTDGTESVTVPYSGIATSLYETQMNLTGSVLATYNFTANTATAISVPGPGPAVFNVTYRGFNNSWAEGPWPAVLVDIQSPVKFHVYKIDLLKGDGDLFMGLASFTNYYEPGNNWFLDGTDQNSTFVPEGEYSFRVSALKIYGNQTKDEDWISHTSEPFVLRYNEDSVGLPSSNSTLRNRRG
ncbi:peptidase S8/S53 domain-containing protein [Leptodontidium sp. 2 PMI_412]|nr:peptidase S8/S53 domain-containing protein [Leptodontidium sp. 2 PMI_412]